MPSHSPTHSPVGRVLYQARSDFQEIVLSEEPDGHINLTLDDVWQFRSQDEFVFHETLADTPMLMAATPARILILGGGDGLALRNVLRHPGVEQVTLCELDPCVLEMTQTIPAMLELSENSLADRRLQLVTGDALAFIETDQTRYDVVICDFPAETRAELSRLFSPDFFRQLRARTHAQSVVAVQVSQDPEGFWRVCDAVERSFAWIQPMLANLDLGSDEDDWADFVIASQTPKQALRDPPDEVRFLSRERIPRLRIRNRDGARFETEEYGLLEF